MAITFPGQRCNVVMCLFLPAAERGGQVMMHLSSSFFNQFLISGENDHISDFQAPGFLGFLDFRNLLGLKCGFEIDILSNPNFFCHVTRFNDKNFCQKYRKKICLQITNKRNATCAQASFFRGKLAQN